MTLVIVLAAVMGVRLALKQDAPPPAVPLPDRRVPTRPEIPPTGSDELDRMLREAQDSVRAADEAVRRAEDRDRRIQADLAEAIARKGAADRAAAAAMNPK